MDERLEIRTFGGLAIQRGRQPVIGFDTRKVAALLVYLACTGRPHPRQVLAEMLWEERTQAQSLANLRVVLTSLKQTVGPYVTITREMAGMNPESNWWLDAAEFERSLAWATQISGQLENALEMYRGDFLEGFYVDSQAFEDWARLERERLRFLAMDAMDILIAQHLGEGAYATGITHATRLLQMDNLREETHRQLMELLALSGQREASIKQYEICRRLLNEELGVAPMPETTALHERIRIGQLIDDRPVGEADGGGEHTTEIGPLRPRHNLPVQTTPFVGREAELTELERLLVDPGVRLITILGPGGMGKTRLAIEAAREQLDRFSHGVFFVSLAPLSTPGDIIWAVAEAVGFQFLNAAPEAAQGEGRDTRQQLLDYFRRKQQLLVMDNFEHLLDGADLLTTILQAAPGVRILATSRERLNLSSETVFTLGGMSFPGKDSLGDALDYDAVQLFLQSARRAQRDFDLRPSDLRDVAQIHHLVGGMPLGLILAAGWVDTFSLKEIAQELSQSLDFLNTEFRDVPDRHRSMRAVFDSTWKLLDEAEQNVFSRLSVFRGGFTREAAQHVAGADLRQLTRLVNKSLLRREPASGRYGIHELLRQYAADHLEAAGDGAATRDRHCAYFAEFVCEHKFEFFTDGVRQGQADLDNLTTAWEWGLDRQRLPDLRSLWIGVLNVFFFLGLMPQAYEVFSRAADKLRAVEPSVDRDCVRGVSLILKSFYAANFGRREELLEQIRLGQALLEEVGWSIERVWGEFVANNTAVHEPAESRKRLEACLAYCQAEGDHQTAHYVRLNLVVVAIRETNFAEAESLARACLTTSAEGGAFGRHWSQLLLGGSLAWQKRWDEAEPCFREALAIARAHHFRAMERGAINELAFMVLRRGDSVQAEELLLQAIQMAENDGSPSMLFRDNLGDIRYRRGAYEDARQLFEEILADIGADADLNFALAHWRLGFTWLALGRSDLARQHFQQSLTAAADPRFGLFAVGGWWEFLAPLVGAALLAAQEGDLERAVEVIAQASLYPSLAHEMYANDAARLRDELEAALPPDVFAAAWARGQARSLEDMVADLLDEWNRRS